MLVSRNKIVIRVYVSRVFQNRVSVATIAPHKRSERHGTKNGSSRPSGSVTARRKRVLRLRGTGKSIIHNLRSPVTDRSLPTDARRKSRYVDVHVFVVAASEGLMDVVAVGRCWRTQNDPKCIEYTFRILHICYNYWLLQNLNGQNVVHFHKF